MGQEGRKKGRKGKRGRKGHRKGINGREAGAGAEARQNGRDG